METKYEKISVDELKKTEEITTSIRKETLLKEKGNLNAKLAEIESLLKMFD